MLAGARITEAWQRMGLFPRVMAVVLAGFLAFLAFYAIGYVVGGLVAKAGVDI